MFKKKEDFFDIIVEKKRKRVEVKACDG